MGDGSKKGRLPVGGRPFGGSFAQGRASSAEATSSTSSAAVRADLLTRWKTSAQRAGDKPHTAANRLAVTSQGNPGRGRGVRDHLEKLRCVGERRQKQLRRRVDAERIRLRGSSEAGSLQTVPRVGVDSVGKLDSSRLRHRS